MTFLAIKKVWLSFVYNILGIRHIYTYVDDTVKPMMDLTKNAHYEYIQEQRAFMQEQRDAIRSSEKRAEDLSSLELEFYKKANVALEKFNDL